MSDATKPEPAPTLFGMIIVTPSAACRKAVDTAIAKVSGLQCLGDRTSESAIRSIYKPEVARLIVNVPADFMLKALGPHTAVLALTAENPPQAAEVFAKTMREQGFYAHVHSRLEPEFPMLSFVVVDQLPGLAFLMWPNSPPPNAPAITTSR